MADSLRTKLELALAKAEAIKDRPNGPGVYYRAEQSCVEITEALASLDDMERDHEAMNELRRSPGDLRWFGESENTKLWSSYRNDSMRGKQVHRQRPADDPTDAILGKKGESE